MFWNSEQFQLFRRSSIPPEVCVCVCVCERVCIYLHTLRARVCACVLLSFHKLKTAPLAPRNDQRKTRDSLSKEVQGFATRPPLGRFKVAEPDWLFDSLLPGSATKSPLALPLFVSCRTLIGGNLTGRVLQPESQ